MNDDVNIENLMYEMYMYHCGHQDSPLPILSSRVDSDTTYLLSTEVDKNGLLHFSKKSSKSCNREHLLLKLDHIECKFTLKIRLDEQKYSTYLHEEQNTYISDLLWSSISASIEVDFISINVEDEYILCNIDNDRYVGIDEKSFKNIFYFFIKDSFPITTSSKFSEEFTIDYNQHINKSRFIDYLINKNSHYHNDVEFLRKIKLRQSPLYREIQKWTIDEFPKFESFFLDEEDLNDPAIMQAILDGSILTLGEDVIFYSDSQCRYRSYNGQNATKSAECFELYKKIDLLRITLANPDILSFIKNVDRNCL